MEIDICPKQEALQTNATANFLRHLAVNSGHEVLARMNADPARAQSQAAYQTVTVLKLGEL